MKKCEKAINFMTFKGCDEFCMKIGEKVRYFTFKFHFHVTREHGARDNETTLKS